jgi:hypothetical protein
VDTLTGTSANDTFIANLSINEHGQATVETLTNLDVLHGGAGDDTLTYYTNNGEALPAATISGIETINISSGEGVIADVSSISGVTTLTARAVGDAVTVDTKSNVTSVTVTGTATTVNVDDAGTAATSADKVSSVSITGATGEITIGSDALTTLSLTGTAGNATVTAAAATRALTLNLNAVTAGTIADGEATSLTVNASGKASAGLTLNAAKATAVTINADEKITAADVNVAAAKSLTVTGDSAVTISAATSVTALATVDSSASTGGLTITPALATSVAVTGGAGKDSVSLATGHAKAVAMGAGDDTVTMAGAVAAGTGSVDGGEGTDTLSMTAADAATVSATTTFEAGISNFEKVKIGQASAATTVNMANIDDISYVISAGGVAGENTGGTPGEKTIWINPLGGKPSGTTFALDVEGVTYTVTTTSVTASAAEFIQAVASLLNEDTAFSNLYTASQQGGATPGILIIEESNRDEYGNFDVTDIKIDGVTPGFAVDYPVYSGVPSIPGIPGTLALTNMASGGTFELTGVIAGASSVAVKDAASGTADVLNIVLNGKDHIVNTAALTVANVETINITTADSSVDTVTLTNPAVASTIMLAAADATVITVSGNHGVDFTGSTLTKVVSLNASGVAATGATSTATAAQIATAGAVTFSSKIDNKAVTVTTGNGADVISVASIDGVSDASKTFLATGVTASTVSTGAGNDTITGSAGKDVIDGGAGNDSITGGAAADTLTGGAGNDTFVYTAATESTLVNRDVITDFSANTYGQGTAGAANSSGATATATLRTGDVLDLSAAALIAITKVAVGVYTNASDATIFLQNNGTNTEDTLGAALDSTTGNLYIDLDSNGTSDMVIQLTGVTTLTTAAFVV